MKLSYNEFRDALVNQIKNYLPEEFAHAEVKTETIRKNNDVQLEAILITTEDQNMAPSIYIEQYYGMYLDGATMDYVCDQIASVRVEYDQQENFDVSRITDFNQVKGNLTARLISQEMNMENLTDRPFTLKDDLAVTYHINIGTTEDGLLTTAVTNQLMDVWGIDKETLHKAAVENTLHRETVVFKSINDTIKELFVKEMVASGELDQEAALAFADAAMPSAESPMYVLTNDSGLFGAVQVMNTDVMDMVSQELGGDVYVLPSSVHEVIIVPASEDFEVSDLEAMVQDVNESEVAPMDRLSDHVYYYDAQAHELYRADQRDAHQVENAGHVEEDFVQYGAEAAPALENQEVYASEVVTTNQVTEPGKEENGKATSEMEKAGTAEHVGTTEHAGASEHVELAGNGKKPSLRAQLSEKKKEGKEIDKARKDKVKDPIDKAIKKKKAQEESL